MCSAAVIKKTQFCGDVMSPLGTLLLVGVTVGFVAGCGPSGPVVHYVEGVIMLDGQPLADAEVIFRPVSEGLMAAGKTNAAGVFNLNGINTRRGGGTAEGEYGVAVRKWEYEDPGPPPDPSDEKAYALWQASSMKAARREPTYITPKAYGDADTSGLKATVKKGRNTGPAFRFDLRSDFTGM